MAFKGTFAMSMLALPRIAANGFESGSTVAERPPMKGIIYGCATGDTAASLWGLMK
jgi:hypothetical protein